MGTGRKKKKTDRDKNKMNSTKIKKSIEKAKFGLEEAIKQKDLDYALSWIDWIAKEAYEEGLKDWKKKV